MNEKKAENPVSKCLIFAVSKNSTDYIGKINHKSRVQKGLERKYQFMLLYTTQSKTGVVLNH